MWQQRRHARPLLSMLVAAVLLLAGSVPSLASECLITDGKVSNSCFTKPQNVTQQLVTARVPLDMRVQWGQAHGYCGEVAVQMVAAHHGVWVGQQYVRDLNNGELLVDSMGSVERILDTLGFSHTTWKVPVKRKRSASAQEDFSGHAALFVVWMKQSIAQGRVPIFGAKIDGEVDPDYDHIMPAYSVQFLSSVSTSSAAAAAAAAAAAGRGGGDGSGMESSRVAALSSSSSSSSSDRGAADAKISDESGVPIATTTAATLSAQSLEDTSAAAADAHAGAGAGTGTAVAATAPASEDGDSVSTAELDSEEGNQLESELTPEHGELHPEDEGEVDIKALEVEFLSVPEDALPLPQSAVDAAVNAALDAAAGAALVPEQGALPLSSTTAAESSKGTSPAAATTAVEEPDHVLPAAVDSVPEHGVEQVVIQSTSSATAKGIKSAAAGTESDSTTDGQSDRSSNQQATGWLPTPAQNPGLNSLTGLYSFSGSDVLTWSNGYGVMIKRAVSAEGFFGSRGSCGMTDKQGGCISVDSPSYAVAMGGLVQPPAPAVAAAAVGSSQVGSTVTATAADDDEDADGDSTHTVQPSTVVPSGHNGVSLAEPQTLFKPLRLVITAWSRANSPANAEPLAKLKAWATGYILDVSGCAENGQPFTVFRFNGYLAFRSTGQVKVERKFLLTQKKPVLANPKSVQELSARCAASKQVCRRATFVQSEGLKVGAKEFGPFSAYSATYFVCVSGAVGATKQ